MVYHRTTAIFLTWLPNGKAARKPITFDTIASRPLCSVFCRIWTDNPWPGEAESPEVKATRAELETVLSEIEKCQGRLANLQTLVADEGSFSHALFAAVDSEEAKLADLIGRKEKLAASLAMARSRATALESPEDLLAIIHSGDPAMRLKLKSEIRKRISRIEVSFGLDGFEALADVKFINGACSAG